MISILQLLSVQVSDMADYMCVAENKVGTVEKHFNLAVQGETLKVVKPHKHFPTFSCVTATSSVQFAEISFCINITKCCINCKELS